MTEVKKEDHSDVVEQCLDYLRETVISQFAQCPLKTKFLEVVTAGGALATQFTSVLKVMKETYLQLLVKFTKGKKYMSFENSWFFHTHLYVDKSIQVEGIDSQLALELNNVWGTLIKCASRCNCVLPVEDQRVILSTTAMIFFDLMSGKIKDKKKANHSITRNPAACNHHPVLSSSIEGTVAAYRFAGFALRSLLENRYKVLPTATKPE